MKNLVAISAVAFTLGFVSLPLVYGSEPMGDLRAMKQRSTGFANVTNPLYTEECGSCHMAYPPGMLTSHSWKKLMLDLENHFGDNAELDADSQRQITGFLLANSAEKSSYRRSRKFTRGIDITNPPLRITETPYFLREHDEIPGRMVKNNPDVKSFSRCDACHTRAVQYSFNENDIRIPGFGQWDD